jgi:hypothetical protein
MPDQTFNNRGVSGWSIQDFRACPNRRCFYPETKIKDQGLPPCVWLRYHIKLLPGRGRRGAQISKGAWAYRSHTPVVMLVGKRRSQRSRCQRVPPSRITAELRPARAEFSPLPPGLTGWRDNPGPHSE